MTVVVGFVFGWWDAAEVVVDASVVEPVDPFEGGEFKVVEAAPWSLVADEFGLVEAVDCFGERVVVTVAAGPDGVDDAVLGQAFGVANRQILDAAVAVMDELVKVSADALA